MLGVAGYLAHEQRQLRQVPVQPVKDVEVHRAAPPHQRMEHRHAGGVEAHQLAVEDHVRAERTHGRTDGLIGADRRPAAGDGRDRARVEQFDEEGLTTREIGAELGKISADTVSRILRGRHRRPYFASGLL